MVYQVTRYYILTQFSYYCTYRAFLGDDMIINDKKFSSMMRLDQGHLHPKLDDPSLGPGLRCGRRVL
jgi:hypothetical protein